ncbi:hypothetical protein [Methyloceanibacter sp.]|uniref:hypothetical protein n=1 Tax=Methyloceanibacter sp. TaxID=1965321 RepID=UPI00351BDBAF
MTQHLVDTAVLAARLGEIADNIGVWSEACRGNEAGPPLRSTERALREIIAELQPAGTDDPNVLPFGGGGK